MGNQPWAQFQNGFRERSIMQVSEPDLLSVYSLYIICPYFKSWKFFRKAILETFRSHFAKIAHKVAKSKYFPSDRQHFAESDKI